MGAEDESRQSFHECRRTLAESEIRRESRNRNNERSKTKNELPASLPDGLWNGCDRPFKMIHTSTQTVPGQLW